MCLLIGEVPVPVRLLRVSGSGAEVRISAAPPIGARVTLRHPVAGAIEGKVETVGKDRLGIAFRRDAHSVAFALAAIAADMSRD